MNEQSGSDDTFTFLLPEELKQKAKMLALKQRRPLGDVIRELLAQWLLEQQGKEKTEK